MSLHSPQESIQDSTGKVCLILGQGLAGSALAWQLHWRGHHVHLIDREEPVTASKIAAGLITPVTGRKMTAFPDFRRYRDESELFYRKVECDTGVSLFYSSPAVRYFHDRSEADWFAAKHLKEQVSETDDDIELITVADKQVTGFRMHTAARVDVPQYLSATKRFFEGLGCYHVQNVDLLHDIDCQQDRVIVRPLDLTGDLLFFCQGFQKAAHPWFSGIPDAPVKGEILTVTFDKYSTKEVQHRGCWVAPEFFGTEDHETDPVTSNTLRHRAGDQGVKYIVGATYDRDDLSSRPTDAGRDQLLFQLKEHTTESPRIQNHKAAVRAATRNRQPVAAFHAESPQLAVLNGLGSHGSLLAPVVARRLIDQMTSRLFIESAKSTTSSDGRTTISATQLAQRIVRRAIRSGRKGGCRLFDATAGNGHDTLFLSGLAGNEGKVIAIDIQREALESARTRVEQAGIDNVLWIQADHAEYLTALLSVSREEVSGNSRFCQDHQSGFDVIMFNLGYLPGGKKTITTRTESTTQAVQAGLELLRRGGVMTVVSYRGHAAGIEEYEDISRHAAVNESEKIKIDTIPSDRGNPKSPVLFVYRKD